MSAATGPPAGLADAEELTPMLSQYADVCARYDDAVVLFRVGDFYKCFCEAAERVARLCELTLIEREDSTGSYAACGVPVDNAAGYVERLLDAGHRVAVADQVEEPEAADGLVDRAVTRVVSPGTVVDDELLAPEATYVAAVAVGSGDGEPADEPTHALAAVDVSTGECLVTGTDGHDALCDELGRLGPAELLVGPDATDPTPELSAEPVVSPVEPDRFGLATATGTLSAYVGAPATVLPEPAERRACGAVLAYAEYAAGDDGPLDHVSRVRRYDHRDALRLDPAALRSLELFETRGPDDDDSRSLFAGLDRTASALGRRRLRAWLRRPLVDADAAAARHEAVAELVDRPLVREGLCEGLREVYDLERLAGAVARGRADARDLRSLAATLGRIPDLREALAGADAARLDSLRDALDPLADVRGPIEAAIRPDPPVEVTEGGLIREGFDDELDELRATEREGRQWVADLEARERERTGIESLEVGHNQVHGYYVEVTDSNADRVPDDYTRRQTLKHSERYYTPELKAREDEILGAAERADRREYELLCELRDEVAEATDAVQALADAVADLDALVSLATVAVERDYTRPAFDDDGLRLVAGRHPTVERAVDGEFVPNDAALDRGEIAVVTGPNMSGKSTYMRQVALCVVLAQAGSFVPADEARLPVVDRVFTRVGASDDIAGGQSTFMREMTELTGILHGATERSLVLLDEVGRGTSTADGRAIARAAVEFLHDEVGATTLFATHYHDLTDLAADLPRVSNLHVRVAHEDAGEGADVTFLHRVTAGAASSSYGVEVARLAGVPDPVVERARALVTADAADRGAEEPAGDGDGDGDRTNGEHVPAGTEHVPAGTEHAPAGTGTPAETTADTASREPTPDATVDQAEAVAVAERLRELDLATTTPLEALTRLHDLQRRLDR